MTTHEAWFQDLIGPDTKSAAAEKSGVSTSTLTHQLRNGHLSAPTVVALSRAYDRDVVRSLAETGHITADEATLIPIDTALQVAPDRKLLEEFARRLRMIRPEDRDAPLNEVADIVPFPVLTPGETSVDLPDRDETTPSVRDDEQDLDEALRDANALRGAAQPRTPRLEEPEDP
ncbi:hypothetical protein [Corynebacterium sp. AOP12-C2-36]|uniref:hypothetical protein n=1 Tax=Corynebacterium sp. AOP12-C2-36 TaxID=3457723 RepID=UPI0040333ABE